MSSSTLLNEGIKASRQSAMSRAFRPFVQLFLRALTPIVMAILFAFGCVAFYGLVTGNIYLCLETIFLAFIPYILWSAYNRVGTLDFFAPDVGFPLAYVVYLFAGTINLSIETEYGFVLPWKMWLYYILGLIAYLVGTRFLRSPSHAVAAQGVHKVFWGKERFLSATLVLLAVGMVARSIAIYRWGLPILHAQDEVARTEGVGGLLGVLALCMEAAFQCLLLYLLVKKPRSLIKYVVIALMVVILLNGVATTNRNALLRLALAALIVIHYTSRRFKFRSIAVIALLFAAFASAIGTFRDVSDWGEAHIEKLEGQGFTRQTYWLLNGYEAVRLPPETFYMTMQVVPQITPYSFGTTSLAALLQILPGHRPGPSEIVKSTLRMEFVGFGAAATILAPMWMDGGLLGIILGMLVFGAASSVLHRYAIAGRSYMWILIYAWFMQNSFKAIKDDVLPELGFIWVITLFVVVSFVAGYSWEKAESDN